MRTLTGSSPSKPSLGKSISRVAAVSAALLMVPLLAMQLTGEVNWSGSDFVVAGILLFLTGLSFVAASRILRTTRQRLVAGWLIALAFVCLWAELAVGIFTDLGS